MPEPIYKNATATTEERIEDLLNRMTVAEKIAQLVSIWLKFDPDSGAVAPSDNMGGGELDPEFFMKNGIGQITRPFGTQPIDPVEGAGMVNRLQQRLREETRLGIPAICHEECLTGFMAQGMTSFASPLNFGSTWEPELIEQVGDLIRHQMRAVGSHQGLAPVADVARDARWGRVEETIGEDPYLVGTMVSHYVKGLQGRDLSEGVIATLKHFAGYAFSEGGRNFAPAHVGRREFVDVFLTSFEMAIKQGGALGVMNAYQDFDGEAPAASRWLLTEILRDSWGFEGLVVSDYGAVSFLHAFHHAAAGRTEAAAMSLKAGLDIELPNPVEFPQGLQDAFDEGLIEKADIDLAVRRILRLKFELGLFENPFVDTGAIDLKLESGAELARKIAAKSMTLLANDGILPLSDDVAKIAVVGPNADEVMALFGNYSFENHVVSTHYPDSAEEVVSAQTVLRALVKRLGEDRIAFARGCDVTGDDRSGFEQAVEMAGQADLIIAVLGDKAGHFRQGTVGEGTDMADLSLPGLQEDLLNAVTATGKPTVLVLLNGRPFAMPDVVGKTAAILEAWFPGQEGAAVIVETLFGDLNPGGKSTLTFSQGAGVQPLYYNHTYLGPGIPRLPEAEPVFPFGHGLSYTQFAYRDLSISAEEIRLDGEVRISCEVTNSGDRPGEEVVQLYLRDEVASISRPVKELKGFKRIALQPNEAKRITFVVAADMLAFTGVHYRKVIEPGHVAVMIGSSSEDIRLKGQFNLIGQVREPGEDRVLSVPAEARSV